MHKITISGFGGQGVLSLGKFISYSAIEQNLNTAWLPSYGPEMRGGTANCSVIYSDEEDVKFYEVPVDTLASAINKRGANVYMLGVLLPIFGGEISEEAAIHAVEHVFESKPKVIPSNIECLKAGIEYMKKNLK